MVERFPARLARAIGYPDAIAADAARAALLVDGAEVVASEEGGRAILQATVAAEPSDDVLSSLAGFAAGRILREEAVLAYEPKADAAILWQAAAAGAEFVSVSKLNLSRAAAKATSGRRARIWTALIIQFLKTCLFRPTNAPIRR